MILGGDITTYKKKSWSRMGGEAGDMDIFEMALVHEAFELFTLKLILFLGFNKSTINVSSTKLLAYSKESTFWTHQASKQRRLTEDSGVWRGYN